MGFDFDKFNIVNSPTKDCGVSRNHVKSPDCIFGPRTTKGDRVANRTTRMIDPSITDLGLAFAGGHSDSSVISNDKLAEDSSSKVQQAAVHVRYEGLSGESKKKLEEVLSEWSKWHAAHGASSRDPYEALEPGVGSYYPFLRRGKENSSESFLMETQAVKKEETDCLIRNCKSSSLYDRICELASRLAERSDKEGRGYPLNASPCLTCGRNCYLLKDCPKPRDDRAVGDARKEQRSNQNQNGGAHVLTPHYQNTPRGKYVGLKPDTLAELKKLVLEERNPPPPPPPPHVRCVNWDTFLDF